MTRVDITLGLLSIMGAIAITAAVGLGEEERMSKASLGFSKRSVESGAQMFDQYCKACHGPNAAGLNCPPLNETSGLHGGDIGPGVAWRLEEQNWDRTDAYGYVYAAISAGRMASTRPDRYRGLGEDQMQMPAWSQSYGGPLRPDQLKDLTNYVVNFREFFPDAMAENALQTACQDSIDRILTTGNPAPSVTTYESACYETLCTARINATDPEYVTPKEPVEPDPKDPKYTDDADQLAADLAKYRTDRAARDAFWNRCQALGGELPPEPVADADAAAGADGADAATSGTADAAGAAAGTGTPGAEGTPGADGTAGTGTPGADAAEATATPTP